MKTKIILILTIFTFNFHLAQDFKDQFKMESKKDLDSLQKLFIKKK